MQSFTNSARILVAAVTLTVVSTVASAQQAPARGESETTQPAPPAIRQAPPEKVAPPSEAVQPGGVSPNTSSSAPRPTTSGQAPQDQSMPSSPPAAK